MRKDSKSKKGKATLAQVETEDITASCFDRLNVMPGAGKRVVKAKRNKQAGIVRAHEDTVNDVMGLCLDCSNRKTCEKSQVPGGIWHCREYACLQGDVFHG